jgi:hypothetical protein
MKLKFKVGGGQQAALDRYCLHGPFCPASGAGTEPFEEHVHERFSVWIAKQEAAGSRGREAVVKPSQLTLEIQGALIF